MYRNELKDLGRETEQTVFDPDQIAPKEQSDQVLHCLPFCNHYLNITG